MADDVTTYHEWHIIAGGLGWHVLLKLCHWQHVSYVTLPLEWLLWFVIVYFAVGQRE